MACFTQGCLGLKMPPYFSNARKVVFRSLNLKIKVCVQPSKLSKINEQGIDRKQTLILKVRMGARVKVSRRETAGS